MGPWRVAGATDTGGQVAFSDRATGAPWLRGAIRAGARAGRVLAASPAAAWARPMSALGGNRPLKFAFDVAMSGRMGMDVDLGKFSPEERKFTASAIATYKGIREVVLK